MKKNQKSLRKAVASSATRRTQRQTLLSALPELLEGRILMSTYLVTNSGDSGTTVTGYVQRVTDISLRQAIMLVDGDMSDSAGSPDVIQFSGNVTQIMPALALPSITNPVVIEGSTGSTPSVELNGTNAGAGSAGLDFGPGAAHSSITGLIIDSFSGAGIVLDSSNVTVSNNYIGTDPTGSSAEANYDGIDIDGNNNTISDNLISGNNYTGVWVTGNGNMLTGNLIGTDETGENAVPNSLLGSNVESGGVVVDNAANTTISGNTISGNDQSGLVFSNDSGSGNLVEGNYIGLDETGQYEVYSYGPNNTSWEGNNGDGINLGTADGLAVSNVLIVGNVIAANQYDGIYLNAATDNTIQGNVIGLGEGGTEQSDPWGDPLGNQGDGITLDQGSSGNLIGGTSALDRNVIAGNQSNGITVHSGAGDNTVQNNYFGVDASGQVADPNQDDGILVDDGQMTIVGNVIASNYGDGIGLEGGTSVVYGNMIGVAADGSTAMGNGGNGVYISGSSGNIIGGVSAGEANIIANNGPASEVGYFGVAFAGVNVASGDNNAIEGNSIYGNTLGIDLGDDGVTLNDSEGHSGANDFQDFPDFDSLTVSGSTVTVTGMLSNAAEGTHYTIDLYNNASGDPSGYGQGQTWVGADLVTIGTSGFFTATFTLSQVPAGGLWSATATDHNGNTSEFSQDFPPSSLLTSLTTLASNPTSATFGQSVTFTATVTGGGNSAPTGSVTFYDGATALATVPLSGDTASLTTFSLTVASHSITAVYSGDANYNSSSAALTEVVGPAASSTVLGVNPTTSLYGQTVTLTATVGPTINGTLPTGTVNFYDGSNLLGSGTLSNGVATFTTYTLGVGAHTLNAQYGGDTNFTSSSGSASESVQVASSTALSVSTPSSTLGQTVTLTATVTPSINGVFPSGTVTFLDGGTTLGTASLNSSGVATLSVSTLPVGTDSLVAQYGGNANFLPSSGTASETVNKAATGTSLVASPTPSTFGQMVTFTATVTPSSSNLTPTGSVSFMDGSNSLGTATLVNGVASLQVSTLAVGGYTITANYGGDSNFTGSSGMASENVNQAASNTALSLSSASSTFGQAVTLTATVTPEINGVFPTGTITFSSGATTLGTVTLNSSGVGTMSVSSLPVGSDALVAQYSGDTNFLSSSGSSSETVNKATSSTALAVSTPSSTLGQSVTLTATVTPEINGFFPTGTVIFSSGGTTLGTVSLNSSGVATVSVSTLPVGSDALVAQYNGDPNFLASSGAATETVNKAGTSTLLVASPATSTFGQTVTLTATVTPSSSSLTPSGSVSFMDGSNSLGTATLVNGVASLQVSTLTVSSHTITANYGGDSNFTASSATASETVGKAASSTAVSVSVPSSTLGQSVMLTATVTPSINGVFPTGLVTFTSGGTTLGSASLNANGVATLAISSLPVGTDSLAAQYAGDNNFIASSGTASETVNKANTGTSLSETPASTTLGQTVTLTATVTPAVSGYVATGSVTFWDGSNSLGSVSLNASDVATLQTSTLVIGGHTITAVYGGDGNFTGSTSNTVTENVNAAPSSIAGTVSNDLTGNGFSSDDAPLAGWTVDLFLNGATTPSQTAVTGSNGTYTFANLAPGSYSVQEVLQTGWTETGGSAGYPLTAISGNNFTGVNFDNFQNMSVSGTVYKDLTGNGFSSDDTALAGVTVNLFENGGTAPVATATSASNGTYSFANLTPGAYSVQEVVPAGYTLTGGAGGYALAAASGQSVSTDKFDNYLTPVPPPPPPPTGSISGYVFCDDNLDGVFDLTTWDGNVVSESGEAGATLTLTGTTTSGASVSQTTTSVTGGYYTFGSLAAGTYTVSLTGYSPDHQAELSHGSVNPTYSTKVTLTSGQVLTGPAEGQYGTAGTTSGLDFAEIAPGGLEGFVWDDANNDGNIDYNEAGIVNVTIQLNGVTYTGAKVSETTVTDNNGEYIFTNLTPGTYTLTEVTPSGFTDGKDSVGSLGGSEYFSSNCGSSSGCSSGSTNCGSNCGNSSCGQTNCGSNCNNSSCGNCCYNDCYSNCGYNCFTNYSTNCYNSNCGSSNCGNCGGNSNCCNSECNCGWSSGCNNAQNSFSSIQIGGCENVGINYNFGETGGKLSGCTTDTASLAFWHNSYGQALLCSLNGGPNATALGNWLAAMFPNMYGSSAKVDFAGMSNSQIAAFYNSNDFNVTGVKLDAAVLSAALSSYVTNSTWAGGTYATKYGFTVSAQGVGYDTISVGSDGVAFGVANNSTVTILQALDATDQQAVDGDLYNGNTTLRSDAYTIYAAIAQNGLSS